ncbi:unnamed protein product [Mytilus edulis]|uniref:Uncharacterized protein n=1 Tax=Mytilus edulis TaxID=6550 RepID=A0A8S3S1Y9_MYTED|nr:unnamed protein product [Mytilus edulis]
MLCSCRKGNDIPNFVAESFLQYVADNVDHNSGTLDGNNTFHGMGIMAAVTPGSFGTKPIPRIDVTSEQIALLAKINISYYKPLESNQMASCIYSNLRKMNYKDVDCSYMVNLLWKVSWPLRSPMPGWSGYMQMVQEGTYPGKSSFAHRYQKPPVVTFDQPLYWKALCIVTNEKTESDLKQIVLRLGGFHTEMSFLGSIGRLMGGSGLHEVLETVYASNAVNHMLSGKAVSRAVRGFMMVENALHILLMKESFRVSLPSAHETYTEADSSECDEIVEKACELYDRFVAGEETTESVEQSSILSEISTKLEATKEKLCKSRTSSLWLNFCRMTNILSKFLIAERTGNWDLHLSSIQEMLPFFVAAGHNLYAKSAYVYLSMMQRLEIEHPEVYRHFKAGHHVLRRTDRFWSGLSTDLTIEQILIRSVKSSGGLTRGRGNDYNSAMQDLTGVGYCTSDQHKEATRARTERDMVDTLAILEYLTERNTFTNDVSLRNIETGVEAEPDVNDDKAESTGNKTLELMKGKQI